MKIFKKEINLWDNFVYIFLIFSMLFVCSTVYRSYEALQKFNESIEIENEMNRKILENNAREVESFKREFRQFREHELHKESLRDQSIKNLKSNGIGEDTDLGKNIHLTSSDLNRIIDKWDNKIDHGTRFKGMGKVFIEASNETGLNPIYILAHAAAESSWGNSYIAKTKNNYFGINCVDSNPSNGYYMGNSLEDGIISGAKWIHLNYYNNGYHTLSSMKKANYATDAKWEHNIISIMNESIRLL